MRSSVDVPNFGEFAAPEVFAEVARRAEAARWDGAIPAMAGGIETARPPELGEVRELVGFLGACRADNGLADTPFDIVVGGMSPAGPAAGRDLLGPLADLGITWWDERMPWGEDLERAEPILRRIDQGPPRI